MSTVFEQPFDEREERYFLAEIIKGSSVSSAILFQLIEDLGIQPRWTEIALPNGRSVSACQKAFEVLSSRPHTGSADALEQKSSSYKKKKRPLSAADPSAIGERIIQPRPMAFATVNSQEYPSTDQLMPSVTGEPSKKKRGRPSKADQEIRAAEAAARGEVYPPPKKHKTPRQSMEGVEGGAPTAIMSTPDVAGPKAPKDTYANEKRGRSSNGQGQARTMSLEDTAKAAEQIRGESGIGRGENFSEPPASEIAAPAALLAGVQEHAARIHDSDALMKDTAHTEISGPPQRYSAPGQGDWATYQQTSA